MTKRAGFAAALVLTAVAAGTAAGQAPPAAPRPFYNVDSEVRFEATVREIALEPRYQGASPFLVLRVEAVEGAARYDVEISPSWFFGQDIHGGEKVRIVGSLVESAGPVSTVIAREIRLRGETFILRDKRGFPSWQGGASKKSTIRRLGID